VDGEGSAKPTASRGSASAAGPDSILLNHFIASPSKVRHVEI
jgi:hypothetical protein